jgi:hypothetical protein
MVRTKKSAFLKVFVRSGEKDNSRLLDIDDDSFLPDGNVVSKEESQEWTEQSPADKASGGDGRIHKKDIEATNTAPPPTRRKRSFGIGSPRKGHTKKNVTRIGELAVKPITFDTLAGSSSSLDFWSVNEKNQHQTDLDFSQERQIEGTTVEENDLSTSSFQIEPAVISAAGGHDSNSFLQFTIEPPSSPMKERFDLGAVNETDEEKSTEDQEVEHSLREKKGVRDYLSEKVGETPLSTSRPRFIKKSMSSRGLGERTSKDKPLIGDEVEKTLNVVPTRPGLGPRKKSECWSRPTAIAGRPNMRGFLRKAMSERGQFLAVSDEGVRVEPEGNAASLGRQKTSMHEQRSARLEAAKAGRRRASLNSVSKFPFEDHIQPFSTQDNSKSTADQSKFLKSSYGQAMLGGLSDHAGSDSATSKRKTEPFQQFPKEKRTDLNGVSGIPKKNSAHKKSCTALEHDSVSNTPQNEYSEHAVDAEQSRCSKKKSSDSEEKPTSRRTRTTREKIAVSQVAGAPLSPRNSRSHKSGNGRRAVRTSKAKESTNSNQSELVANDVTPPGDIDDNESQSVSSDSQVHLIEIDNGETDKNESEWISKESKKEKRGNDGHGDVVYSGNIVSETALDWSVGKGNSGLVSDTQSNRFEKGFKKDWKVPTTMDGKDPKYIREELQKASVRLEDARRLVSKLEDEVKSLTESLQKSELLHEDPSFSCD